MIILFFLGGCASKEEKREKHLKRARQYVEGAEYEKAVVEFKNVIQLEPDDDIAYLELGETYLKLKQGREAFQAFSRAISINPDNLKAQIRVGQLLLLGKRPEEARKKAELVLERSPDDNEALRLLAALQLQEKDIHAATKTLERAAELNPESFETQLALARVAVLKKDLQTAETLYLGAISLRPSSEIPYIELSRLYSSRGRPDLAEAQLEQMIQNSGPSYQNLLVLAHFYETYERWKEAEEAYVKAADNRPREDIGPLESLAAYYARRKSYDKAMEVIMRALDTRKGDLNLLFVIAQLQFDSNHLQDADSTLDKILKKDKNNPRANLLKGRIALLEKDFAAALNYFNVAIRSNPEDSFAYYFRGLCYIRKGESRLAQQDLLKALELNPGLLDARLALARLYLGQRKQKLASQQIGELVKQAPGDVRVIMAKGILHVLENDAKGAEECFKKVIELEPEYVPGYVQLGLLSMLSKKESDALGYFEKALELRPFQMDALALMVALYVKEKRFDKAFEICAEHRRKVEQNPAHLAFIDYLQGKIFLAKKDFPQAEQYFKRAVSANPNLLYPYLALARIYVIEKRQDEAIREYQAILSKNPNYLAGYMALAAIYDERGEAEKAEIYYRKVLEIDQDFGPALNNLAWNLAERGKDIDDALAYAQMAKRQMPGNAAVMDTLGLIYHIKGRYLLAIAEFQESLMRNPDNALINYHLGMAYYKAGRIENARGFLEKALQIDQDFKGAEKARALLKELGGNGKDRKD
ncbi:MAG: tetratricopeptide repeat protein [Deltaproteobacteria bacterium]|nr:tetratricopeptide repeat protein [Deltaproteobacteria bacterium]